MIDSKTLNHLARNPKAMMDFHATGKLPQMANPSSPLITLLRSIHPSELRLITAVRIGSALGYNSNTPFQNAAQALNWLKPNYSAQSYPSESHQNRRFTRALTIDDLARCANVPEMIRQDWWQRNPGARRHQQDSGLGL
jgi:hypothetical protein